ncbi:hypothetical protein D3C81_1756800 [compost metagenome]
MDNGSTILTMIRSSPHPSIREESISSCGSCMKKLLITKKLNALMAPGIISAQREFISPKFLIRIKFGIRGALNTMVNNTIMTMYLRPANSGRDTG